MFAQRSLGGRATAAQLRDAADCTPRRVSVGVHLSVHTKRRPKRTLTVQLIDYITHHYATKKIRK